MTNILLHTIGLTVFTLLLFAISRLVTGYRIGQARRQYRVSVENKLAVNRELERVS